MTIGGLSLKFKINKNKSRDNIKKRTNLFNDEGSKLNKTTKIKISEFKKCAEPVEKELVIVPIAPPLFETKSKNNIPISTQNISRYGLSTSVTITKYSNEQTKEQSMISVDHNIERAYIESLPDVPSESEYDEVPVEGFGAALLRGMGWSGIHEDDHSDLPRKNSILPHKQINRPAFLGLGAKSSSTDDTSLAILKKHEPFMPIVKIDKQTGELID